VIVCPDATASTSLAVPTTDNVWLPKATVPPPVEPEIDNVVLMLAVLAAVKRPSASTVKVGIDVALP